ncbi:MAG: hypothetical protein IPM57_07445 [Oligoflexia bacterium]|nr:hypothetical protein [Oligoflexia bacterium]
MLKLMLTVLLMLFALETWAQNSTFFINDARGVDPQACMQIVSQYKPVRTEYIGAFENYMLHFEIGKTPQGLPILKCKKNSYADKKNKVNTEPYSKNRLKSSDCSCEGKVILTLIK